MNSSTTRPVTSLRILALILLATCGFTGSNAVHAQAAVNYYGSSCGLPSPWGTPLMGVGGLPRLGMGVGFMALGMSVHRFDNRQPPCEFAGTGYLFLGASNQSWRGMPLPFLLPFELTASFPCRVWAGPDVWVGPPSGLPPFIGVGIPKLMIPASSGPGSTLSGGSRASSQEPVSRTSGMRGSRRTPPSW